METIVGIGIGVGFERVVDGGSSPVDGVYVDESANLYVDESGNNYNDEIA